MFRLAGSMYHLGEEQKTRCRAWVAAVLKILWIFRFGLLELFCSSGCGIGFPAAYSLMPEAADCMPLHGTF